MKILIRHEHNASHFIYSGLGNAFRALGHEYQFWDAGNKPAFDIFDEYQPDLFIGQGYNLDRATIKCVLERASELKVLLKVGCFGPVCDDVDTEEYPILMASEQEKKDVNGLASQLQDHLLLFNYVHNNRLDYLMKEWKDIALCYGLLPAADTVVYKETSVYDNLKCDLAFVGGYWPYKARNFDKYLLPLCYPVGKYNIKIFGNQIWPVSQYLGVIDDSEASSLFASATICPNISEPHANVFGFEVNERIFKLAASKAFFISDPIASLTEDIFANDEAVIADNPEHFRDLVDTFLDKPHLRDTHIQECYDTVMSSHTYEHRANDIIQLLELDVCTKES